MLYRRSSFQSSVKFQLPVHLQNLLNLQMSVHGHLCRPPEVLKASELQHLRQVISDASSHALQSSKKTVRITFQRSCLEAFDVTV